MNEAFAKTFVCLPRHQAGQLEWQFPLGEQFDLKISNLTCFLQERNLQTNIGREGQSTVTDVLRISIKHRNQDFEY